MAIVSRDTRASDPIPRDHDNLTNLSRVMVRFTADDTRDVHDAHLFVYTYNNLIVDFSSHLLTILLLRHEDHLIPPSTAHVS